MPNLRNDLALEPVVFNRFTGEADEDVVKVMDLVICAPFDQLEIPHACRVLSHYLEYIGRKALDAGLDRKQAAPSHLLKLPSRDVRTDLIMELNIGVGLSKLSKQLVRVFGRQNIVDGVEMKNPVAPR